MKFKICPHCKTRNHPSEDRCVQCGISIENVRSTDEETEKARQEETPSDNKPIMVRICENCDHANPLKFSVCQKCGEDLTGIDPQPQLNAESSSDPMRATLISLDEQWAYELQPGDTMVGRSGAMSEYLRSKKYVSREHAIFSWTEGKLFVTHVGKSNQTYVNGQPVLETNTELHDGDSIGLGGDKFDEAQKDLAAFFVVRVCKCT